MRGKKIPIRAYKVIVKEEFYKTYQSMGEAERELALQESSIRRILTGERITTGGFTFRRV